MFSVCRKGPASISRVIRAASSTARIPSTRPSTLSLSFQNIAKPSLEARWLHVSPLRCQEAGAQRSQQHESGPTHTINKFDELIEHNLVHPNVVKAITEGMGHHTMTQVQTMTINQALQGTDIIAQARTGTGKTIGFLLPMIQNILRKNPQLAERQRYSNARASDIKAIIISPTRELAEQIAVEASKLCQKTDLIVQVAVGGNSKREMLRKVQREGCHILVATPGRLNDLLTDPYSKVEAPGLTTLVLDEADRLLDDGFSKDIEDIIELLPSRREVDRQTMLFSATMPREVMTLVRRTLKPDFHFVQTVQEGDIATHDKVPQKIVAVPGMENLMPTLLELAKREIDAAAGAQSTGETIRPFKAIVYFASTANVILASEIFQNLKASSGGLFGRHPLAPADILVMHGQLTQERRTRNSDRFRRAQSAILFSTDVTARGMDFPNVTHVVQIGLPSNREQYVHRIGRTGRGSQTGDGLIMVLHEEVSHARRMLRGLPITNDVSLEAAKVDMTAEAQLPTALAATLTQVGDATKMVDRKTKDKAYLAALSTATSGAGPAVAIKALNQWSRYGWGWDTPPAINPSLAQKLGLSRIPGANIGRRSSYDDEQDSRDKGFGSKGFGGRGGDRGGFGGGRGGRGFGGDRESRGFGDRGDKGGRGFGGDRESRGFGDRGDRGGRGGFGDRGGRGGDRGFGERNPNF